MFPSNLLPSTYSKDSVNNSPKQAFILKSLSGPSPFSPPYRVIVVFIT